MVYKQNTSHSYEHYVSKVNEQSGSITRQIWEGDIFVYDINVILQATNHMSQYYLYF